MNDVDSVTTKKVDTVMRQGDKAVILKINGDKKASKKLFFTETEQIRLMPQNEYMYSKVKQEYGISIADYFYSKNLYVNARGRDYKNDKKMKEVYEWTKGVCQDFAAVQNLSLDYFGIRSYIISNHAVCKTSSVVPGDKEPVMYIWSNNNLFKMTESIYKSQEELYTSESYDKIYRKLMGNDYPFK